MVPTPEEGMRRMRRPFPPSIVVNRVLLTFLALLGATAIVGLSSYLLANQTYPTDE